MFLVTQKKVANKTKIKTMKYIITTSLAFFALAFVLLPPLDPSGGICIFNITDADDSIFNCQVSFSERFRVNNTQVASFSSSEIYIVNTGNNSVLAGDDVQNATVGSGGVSISNTRLNIINRFVLTIN